MRKQAWLFLTCALACSSCSKQFADDALSVITSVVSTIANITAVIGQVDEHVRKAAADGVLPPGWADRVDKVRALADRISDAAQRGPQAFRIAVSEFERAWSDLLSAAEPYGVQAGDPGGGVGKLSAVRGGTLVVDGPAVLSSKLLGERP